MNMLSVEELSQECKKVNMTALLSRDDERNSECAIKLCKYMHETGKILYFSLRNSISNFKNKDLELPMEIDDTAGIDIEMLELKVHNSTICLGGVVIDYLLLMSNHSVSRTRQTEIEDIVSRLKKLSYEINVPILVLIPLSKYVPIDYPIMQEMNQYGDIKDMFDLIVYVNDLQYDNPFHILQEEKNYEM